jgi:uncharacterized protein YheU (UPF0270 family)
MKQTLHITAIIDQPDFLENIVEKLVLRHNSDMYNDTGNDQGSLETSSTETYVSGTMEIDDQGQHIEMPFITSFLFTCIKISDNTYSLEWSNSLS